MQVAAVILAAGASRRFGSPKQRARLGSGSTMLEAVVDLARGAGLDPIIAVVPPGFALPADVVPEINSEPAAGLSRSLRRGLAAVPPAVHAAIVLLGDQPTLSAAAIRAILAAARSDRPVVAAQAGGLIGPPVLLARSAFVLADETTGDEGLRGVLGRHVEMVTTVEVGEHAPDVDTPADLARIAHMFDSSVGR
jgi:CTP:molybdopterin cytidylyltransferase MocA